MLNSTIFILIKLFLHLGRKANDEIENKKKNLKNFDKDYGNCKQGCEGEHKFKLDLLKQLENFKIYVGETYDKVGNNYLKSIENIILAFILVSY
jgi:hypothetical protein